MLNSCELQFAQAIDVQNPEQSIEKIAQEIDPTNVERVKQQLSKIYADYSGHTDSLGIEALHSIFKIRNSAGKEVLDNRFLLQVKRKVNETIVKSIFSGKPFTTGVLTNTLKGISSIYKRDLPVNESWKFVVDRQTIIGNNEVDRFSSYLLAFHMPLLINSWYNKIITYDPDTGQYEYNIHTKIRTDWNTDAFEEQEAELNNMLEIMLNATQLRDYGTSNVTFVPNIYLTKNSFFYAIAKFSEYIAKNQVDGQDHYAIFTENPYYVFEYVKNNPIDKAELWVNVLKSFADTWLYTNNEYGETVDTKFIEDSKKSLKSEFNPLHVLLTTIVKYRPQAYSEISLGKDGKFSSTVLDIDSGNLAPIIAKTSIKIKNTSTAEIVAAFPGVFKVSNNKLTTVEGAPTQEKLQFVKWMTESNVSLEGTSSVVMQSVDAFLGLVAESKNMGTKFDSLLKSASYVYVQPMFLALTRNLPYVKGTTVNALGKQLPTIGISSVTHSMPTEIYSLKHKVRKNKDIYWKHNEQGRRLHVPTTVAELSTLWDTEVSGLPKTIYRSTINYHDGELIKDPTELSISESFKLSFIADYLQAGKNTIRIEAITPSDKKRIPFFEFDLSKLYVGDIRLSDFEDAYEPMLKQISQFYKQSLVNTINDFIQVLNIQGMAYATLDTDAATIQNLVKTINSFCINNNVNEDALNIAVQAFNSKYGTNKVLANILDTSIAKINGKKIIQVSNAAVDTFNKMNEESYWNDMYIHFLNGVRELFPSGLSKAETKLPKDINIAEEIEKVSKGKHTNSELYKYFVYTNFLAENILVNTVGLPLAHKAKGANDFASLNTKSHVTMVKRMVAHTATMHACVKGIPSGLPNQINMMTWAAGSTPIFTYSTNSAGGKNVQDDLDIMDGAIIGVRCVDTMLRQSMADVKPKGNMLKLLMHDLHEEKCASSLVKCAELSIDNAYLRSFENEDNALVGGWNPVIFMQLALQNCKLTKGSLPKLISAPRPSKKIGDVVTKLKTLEVSEDGNQLIIAWDSQEEVDVIDNNLFALWKACGGAWSCNRDGVYNEDSQDFITYLFNNCKSGDGIQYLKTQAIHYFPTDTTQKSLQNPIVQDLYEAAEMREKQFIVKMDISRFGVQLDADHSSEDSHIREVSQLMSNLAEGNYTPAETNYIYNALSQLVTIMEDKIGVDFNNMTEEDKKRIDKLFGDKILRIFDDPTVDVMGLANRLSAELLEYNKTASKPFIIPYSDRQFLSKYHTTTGSYFNKFIARKWSGRGDVIVPSHNMAMMYEDLDGNTYLPSDNIYVSKAIPDGSVENTSENIKQHLRSIVRKNSTAELVSEHTESNIFENDSFLYIKDGDTVRPFTKDDFTSDFINNVSLIVDYHEVRPGDNYYRIIGDTVSLISNVRGLKQLYAISDDIANNPEVVYYRAIDLPRNLKSKQVGISEESNGIFHDIFHSKTYRQIWMLDNYIKNTDYLTDSQKSDIGIGTVDEAVRKKRELQERLEKVVLPALKVGTVNSILSEEFGLEIGTAINLVVKNDETIIANNNSHTQGDASWAEINQQGIEYFRKRLETRFNAPNIKELHSFSGSFYTNDGHIVLTTSNPEVLPAKSVRITPIVDEDGYRIDKYGNRMYKVSENAAFYKSGNYDIIITDDISALQLSEEKAFVAFRWYADSERPINSNKLLKEDNSDALVYNNIAAKQLKAWKASNNMISARIPSQSMSFAAALKVAAYTPWHSNTIMVPNNYVYIQGSDYDIDKIFSIMMGLDKSGILPQLDELSLTSSKDPVSTFNADEQQFNTAVASALLNSVANAYLLPEDVHTLKQMLSNIIFGYKENNVNISETPCRYNKSEVLRLVVDSAIAHGYTMQDDDISVLNARFDALMETLSQFTSTVLTSANQELGITATQNSILNKMLNIWNDPVTAVAASTPTTMRPIKAVIEDKSGLGTATRYHHNPLSNILINQTTAVGRKGISIAASGQKALLALNYYYSQFGEKSLFKPFEFAIPKDWQTYKSKAGKTREFGEYFTNFIYPGVGLNTSTIQDIVSYIVGEHEDAISVGNYTKNNCTLTVSDDHNGGVYYDLKIAAGDNTATFELRPGTILNSDAAYKINSALISSATDNAKEMDLDLINGSPEILPAYIFGLSVGIPMALLVNIFTDPVIPNLITAAKGDIFRGEKKKRVSTLLGDSKIVSDGAKRSVLKKLFDGADNLTALASLLSINQGIEVYNGAAMEFQLDFEKTINDSKSQFAPKFNAETFFTASPEERAEIVKLYEKSKDFYNILDIFAVSNHFYQMGKVPFILKRVVENTSKDIQLLHGVMRRHSGQFVENQQKTANNVLKVLNQIKIFEFLRQLNFEYTPDTVYDHRGNVIAEENTEAVNINTLNGMSSFKMYVEQVVFNTLKSDPTLEGNQFIENLTMDSIASSLFYDSIDYLSSRVKLSDPQNIDKVNGIKLDFYNIADKVVNGHTVFEWFFLYDLMVHHHNIGGQSLTLLFDQDIDLEDESNLITQWVRFVNEYDAWEGPWKISEADTIADYYQAPKESEMEDGDQDIPRKHSAPYWVSSPTYLPLYVDVNSRFNSLRYLHRSKIAQIYANGNLLIYKC